MIALIRAANTLLAMIVQLLIFRLVGVTHLDLRNKDLRDYPDEPGVQRRFKGTQRSLHPARPLATESAPGSVPAYLSNILLVLLVFKGFGRVRCARLWRTRDRPLHPTILYWSCEVLKLSVLHPPGGPVPSSHNTTIVLLSIYTFRYYRV
jgi:hypothetical protein